MSTHSLAKKVHLRLMTEIGTRKNRVVVLRIGSSASMRLLCPDAGASRGAQCRANCA